jgi:uncharacterized membrane protein YebE (DUF533 family)
MIDAKALLERFLGPGGVGSVLSGGPSGASAPSSSGGSVPQTGRGAPGGFGLPGGGSFAGGAAAGGLLGLVLGNKKLRKMGGGVLSHGGAAVLGALAYRAWQNWQQGQAPATAPTVTPSPNATTTDERFLPSAAPAADGQPFELALVRAMIGAAKADGHIDAEEQRAIFAQVERAGLDAEAKAFVFDALAAPVTVADVAAAARTPEQAAEIYLASRLAIDPDEPAERAYLEALAHRLALPPGLAAHLDRQAEGALAGPAA